jgi:Serine/Threonine/Tyrosine Kinase found in polyvalent proteins
MKDELQNVISGKGEVIYGNFIQTIASYLKRSTRASELVKESEFFRKQETEILIEYITANQLWVKEIKIENYVSQGAEQKVYLQDGKSVLKLNDAIFYASWTDYFHNLLLNNFFFPDTAYELLGFHKEENTVYAVVKQPFVRATEKTDLELVKKFMAENGFINNRNNDYYNPDLGIILEDLHDENVLTENGILQFIDTVFYVTDVFYEKINN